MLRIAAVKAEMVTFAVGAIPERVERCIDLVHGARTDAGLDPSGITLGAYVPVAVTGANVTRSRRATRSARPRASFRGSRR